MLPDIMSQRLPSVTEAEASVQCLVSRGSLSLSLLARASVHRSS